MSPLSNSQPDNDTTSPACGALDMVRADWAQFGLTDDVRPLLQAARAAGEACALVTLYRAKGGAPRGVGAQLAVRLGEVAGFLSGGCIEADVTLHALETLRDGIPRRLVYGEGGPVDIRLPCGGSVELLVERISPDDEATRLLLEFWHARRTALRLSDGVQTRVLEPAVSRRAVGSNAASAGVTTDSAGAEQAVFRYFFPRPRLVLFGSDPMAIALSGLARQSGIETFLVRPRGPERGPDVPGIRYSRRAQEEVFTDIGVDAWTAIVVAMHDDIDDHTALLHALPSPAGYVGLLGARRHAERKIERLRVEGVNEAALARLRAPVGLPLGGRSPWAIATSILAELVQWSSAAQAAFIGEEAGSRRA